jgi:hypothetical protein
MYQITVVVALQKENADFFSPHKSRIFRDSRSTIASSQDASVQAARPRKLLETDLCQCTDCRQRRSSV